jgi:hypothetical protein
LAACKLDLIISRTLKRAVKKLKRHYPNLDADLKELQKLIEKDHTTPKANATLLRMPKFPDLQNRIWKYDLASSDIKKHQRESLRLICIFLDDPNTLYAIHVFLRDGNDFVSPQEMAPIVRELRMAIEAPISEGLDEEAEANAV